MSDCNQDFARVIAARREQIDIAHAALVYAREAYPDLDVDSYLRRLDEMADAVRPRLNQRHPISAFRDFLFGELGFRGNQEDYFDPRNSFLNQVMDRRMGIPITLSVIYLELARRLELPVVGIGLPGHFIVRYDGDQEPIYIDPFNGGVTMNLEDCRQRVTEISNGRLPFKASFLEPLTARQVLTRMLRNLKGVYVARGEFDAAVSVVEKMILLNPSVTEEIRDLGVLYYYAGRKLKAIGCLERYVELSPKAEDIDTVQHNLRVIIEKVARWN
jgi:regulator of sirC expression with transglutaminase-like and TPR domain